ncbi:serine/threonine-protein kinase [Actinomadura opuntiae]|uniref:serine/threonine-protein kinase n=1 Tax=Actinomadura sp. OS1-43 TaxID=604315 RepID=UPI00255A760F|nr:serine/threonine-protein kinase [Actinomadura sp. OS1-43]MDL4815011.1 serine/threonine-protein kinase [Actinomadura sp. OS1-43]
MTEPPPPTRRRPGEPVPGPQATRRRGGGTAPLQPETVPPALLTRFREVSPLSLAGGEADVFRAVADDGEYVLKLYRGEIRPEPKVWEALQADKSPRLPRLLDCGVEGGRAYEIHDYVPGGTLHDLIRRTPGGLPLETVEEVVRQLAGALRELHGLGIPHRDLKPQNVLVRGEDPLNLVLADFGMSVHLGGRSQARTRSGSRTTLYAAPELFNGLVSAAGDWWSLGMLVLEAAAGEHPFAGMDEDNAGDQIIAGNIPLPDDLDPRVRWLCEGLIVHSRDARWDAEEVGAWLAGDPPRPPRDRGPVSAPQRRELRFNGTPYTERFTLAHDLTRNWGLGVQRFFEPMAEPWAELRRWLAQFDDPDGEDTSERLAVRLERSGLPGNVNLLLLLRWLDHGRTVVYRGEPLSMTDLPDFARRAMDGDGTAAQLREIVDDLWDHGLLRELDAEPGCAGFAQVDRRWRWETERWTVVAARLAGDHPEVRDVLARWSGPRQRAYLLWLAGDPGAVGELRAHLDRERSRVHRVLRRANARLDWFDEILAKAHEPAGVLAAYAVSWQARAEVERLRRQADRRDQRVREWNRVERWRRLDRPVALGWAGAAMAVVLIAWTLLLLLSTAFNARVEIASPVALLQAWIFMVVTLALQAGAELWLAAVIGAPYHPRFSLMLGVGRVFRDVGGRFATRGTLGFAVVAGTTLALIGVTVAAPFLLPLIVLPAHVAWVHVRYRRWQEEYLRRRSTAVGPDGAAARGSAAGRDGPRAPSGRPAQAKGTR